MKRKFYLIVIAIAGIVASCSQEKELDDSIGVSGNETVLRIETRAPKQGDDPDDVITSLRVMAFDRTTGICMSNKLYNTSLGATITHIINYGTYDFVFLANEPGGPTGTSLANIFRRTELDAIAYSESLFASDKDIPMMQTVENVEVLLNNNGVKINGGIAQKTWALALIRLAARIDIVLTSKEDLSNDFTGVRFSNLADKVPLTGNYTGTISRNVSREFLLTNPADGGYFENVTLTKEQRDAGIVWAKKIARVILPSSEFTPKTSAADAVTCTVLLHDQYNPSCTMGVDEESNPKDYTLPRNNWLDCEGDVGTPLVLNITPKDWTPVGADGDIRDNRELNISVIETVITPINNVVISFTSNMPNVTLEETGKFVSSTVTFHLNDYYAGLTGSTPANFVYSYNSSTQQGKGTITINTINLPERIGDLRQIIFLNAGGLRREIRLNAKLWYSTHEYVGTFHRASEVGERVIAFDNTGAWTATVSYAAGQEEFVVLSSTRSHDLMIGTDTPGDPELYPVIPDGNGQTVSGNGRVYFRVGMKSRLSNLNPDWDTPPRYAKITLTCDKGPMMIYVRQGEAADYVMHPGDPDTGGIVVNARNAKEFSPYNLTAAAMTDALPYYVALQPNGGVPVDYPTKAGAFFQWAGAPGYERRAYHPTIMESLDWNGTSDTSSSWNSSIHETCPPGYRRPIVGGDEATLNGEMAESLCSNLSRPQRRENSISGYYADGFFDRRVLASSVNKFDFRVVSPKNKDAAYVGRLFYNPVINSPGENASVFFPLTGRRSDDLGEVGSAGGNSYYWSSVSLYNEETAGHTHARYMVITTADAQPFSYSVKPLGNCIRCVKD